MTSRILVVEDDDTQQFVLKAALEKKGFIVDVATDGLTAVRKLRSGEFDLALVDYRIPEVDGLTSAKLLHDMMDQGVRPKLVAITASSHELEARAGNDGVFDAIIPKPLDLDAIVKIVSNEIKNTPAALSAAAANAIWHEYGLARAPAALVMPEPTQAQRRLLQSLFDISGEREPEIVAIASTECSDILADLRETSDYFDLPFIDMTGHYGDIADGSVTDFDPKRLAAVATTIRQFEDRRRRLSPRYRHPRDTDSRLLAYLFLTGQTLHPVRFAQTKACVRYAGFFSVAATPQRAHDLEHQGLLEEAFFDRIHVCSHCNSGRLNVREECPTCRSSHLHEEALIHHFRCAYQGPESTFRSGRDLVCPKCRQHLRHYGSDYDKPGTTFTCAQCDAICSDVAVGFVCFDCGTHMDGEAIARRDINSYRLTDTALRLLTASNADDDRTVAPGPTFPRLLSNELVKLVNAQSSGDATVSLAEITYEAQDSIIASRGRSGFETLRAIFLDNLRGAMSDTAEVYSADDRDFLLAHAGLGKLTQELLELCQKALAEPLNPHVRQLDPFGRSSVDDRPALSR